MTPASGGPTLRQASFARQPFLARDESRWHLTRAASSYSTSTVRWTTEKRALGAREGSKKDLRPGRTVLLGQGPQSRSRSLARDMDDQDRTWMSWLGDSTSKVARGFDEA